MRLKWDDPLMQRLPIGSRIMVRGRSDRSITLWWRLFPASNARCLLDMRDGAQAKVRANENLEAMQRGLDWTCRPIAFDLCPHSTFLPLNLSSYDLIGNELTAETGPLVSCSWCQFREWVSITALARKHSLPLDVEQRMFRYLSMLRAKVDTNSILACI